MIRVNEGDTLRFHLASLDVIHSFYLEGHDLDGEIIPDQKAFRVRRPSTGEDGEAFLDQCIIGLSGCNDNNPCPLHQQWSTAKQIILEILKSKNVAEFGEEIGIKLNYIKTVMGNVTPTNA